MEEKLRLKWNDFQDNVRTSFGSLRQDTNFSDVTLVCEDGQQFELHKVVLVSSSSFFKNLLTRNKHPHPLIYMRGVRSEELAAIMDFLYQGEANLLQDGLDSFLVLAEELQLKGFTRQNFLREDKTEFILPESVLTESRSSIKTEKVETFQKDGSISTIPFQPVVTKDYKGLTELEEQVQSMLKKSPNMISIGKGSKRRRGATCKVCGKEGMLQNIKRHIEAYHLDKPVAHPCNLCDKTSRTKCGLWKHKNKDHKKHL